ncbi:ShlB/FhaC/HecB family hemolysin secretion/activation protein [Adonisia turfae]|nr:ShlB/FhaC/HecB family hemolysin secretion/activation protein [Adonisia turfae]
MALSVQAQTPPRVVPPEPEVPPEPAPEAPASPEDVLPDTSTDTEKPSPLPDEILETEITVTELRFDGNSILDDTALQQAIEVAIDQNFTNLDEDDFACEAPSETTPWLPTQQTISQLLQFAEVVAACYKSEGYTTSGAVVQVPEDTKSGIGPINVLVIEGELETIDLAFIDEDEGEFVDVTGTQRLNDGYVRSRLGATPGEPLNVTQLQENLQLLQIDPLIQRVRADLNAGSDPGDSRLEVKVQEAPSLSASVALDNSRPPSVGTTQRQAFVREGNLFGIGDALSLGITNSEGSNAISVDYSIPINANNGRLSLSFDPTWNDIVDSDFFDINRDGDGPDIQSRAQLYELALRQPILRQVKGQTYQEFTLGLSGTLRNSRSFLLEDPFPLSAGASVDGKTRTVALRFSQDYTRRDGQQIFSASSQFNLGLGILNATVNNSVDDVGAVPDSRFFSWQGQLQWTKVLAPQTLLLLRSNIQLADQVLLSAEQFSLGGGNSVRGYRQDQLITDNGVFASAEMRVPIARMPESDALLQVTPFLDFGTGWNSSGQSNPDDNTLASFGLGLQLTQGKRNELTARLDWGIPLISVDSEGDTWQENGVYFSIVYRPL